MPAAGRHPVRRRRGRAGAGGRDHRRTMPRNRSGSRSGGWRSGCGSGGVSHRAALREFADGIDDRVGDTVAAALLLAFDQQSGGVARVLRQLAAGVARDVRARRDIEAERAEARQSMRMLLLIQIGVLGLLAAGARLRRPLPHRPRAARDGHAAGRDRGAAGVDAPARQRAPRTPVPRHHHRRRHRRPSRGARECSREHRGAGRRRRRGAGRDRRRAGCGRVGALRTRSWSTRSPRSTNAPPTTSPPTPTPRGRRGGGCAAGCWRWCGGCRWCVSTTGTCGCSAGPRDRYLLGRIGAAAAYAAAGPVLAVSLLVVDAALPVVVPAGFSLLGGLVGWSGLRPPGPGPGRGRPRSAAPRPGGLPDPGQPAAPRRGRGGHRAAPCPPGCSTTAGRCAGSPISSSSPNAAG